VGELPAPVRVESAMARFSFQCSRAGSHARCLRVFSAGRKRWPPQQLTAFSKMMDTVVLADRTQIACQKEEVPPQAAP
jgi:hypothetical protein